MARVSVTHTIGDLAADCDRIAATTQADMSKVVRKNLVRANKNARAIARAAAGPHGTNYYKRITAEMISPLVGEFGPEGNVVGNAVGAGWRHGPPNTDLPKAADLAGPMLAKDVSTIIGRKFW